VSRWTILLPCWFGTGWPFTSRPAVSRLSLIMKVSARLVVISWARPITHDRCGPKRGGREHGHFQLSLWFPGPRGPRPGGTQAFAFPGGRLRRPSAARKPLSSQPGGDHRALSALAEGPGRNAR